MLTLYSSQYGFGRLVVIAVEAAKKTLITYLPTCEMRKFARMIGEYLSIMHGNNFRRSKNSFF